MYQNSEYIPARGIDPDGPDKQRFFGKQIEVTTEGEMPQPAAFQIDDQRYEIDEIILSWADTSYGSRQSQRQARWWQRHHRTYYRVTTTDGKRFEIYHDRGTSLKNPKYRKWYVTREL